MVGTLVRRCILAVCLLSWELWLPVYSTSMTTLSSPTISTTSTSTTTKKPSPSPTPPTTRLAPVHESSETLADQQNQVAILKQINRVNDDGSYTFGYEAADGSFKIETRDVLGNVKGMFGFLDESGQLKRVSYSANNATGFRQSGSLNPTPEQTEMRPILVTGQHIRNQNEEFTPQIRTVETSTPAGPVLKRVLITRRPLRPNLSATQDGEIEDVHQTEHTGLQGNALRRQLHFGPPVPISLRPDDTSDVYGPTTASPGRRLPGRITSVPPRQIQNILEPTTPQPPLVPPVPPGSYPLGGLDPRLRRLPPGRDHYQNLQGFLLQRPSHQESLPLPPRLSPLMRILLRMLTEEAAALEPYLASYGYGPRPYDDYRSRPYNDPYHSRTRRPYDNIYHRQRNYEDYLSRMRSQDDYPIAGRPDDHYRMEMYDEAPYSHPLPIPRAPYLPQPAPLPPPAQNPRYDVYENPDPYILYRKQRPIPASPSNAYPIHPYRASNQDSNELDENQLLRRLLATRGRLPLPQKESLPPPLTPPTYLPTPVQYSATSIPTSGTGVRNVQIIDPLNEESPAKRSVQVNGTSLAY